MTGGGARRESKVKVDIQTSTSSATSPSTEGSNDEYICTFVPKVGFISYLPFMGGEVYLRIPTTEGKLPITALTREYPGAVGLRYKNSEDQKSSVRSDGDFLFPPLGADKKFEVILDTQIGTPIKSSTSWDFKTIALVLLAFVVVMLVLFIFSTRESEKGLSALDVVHESGLLNLFGKYCDLDQLEVAPILLKRGCTKIALYGIGSQRDHRLARAFG
uniref:TDP43_N domain-containing protein n=1 Tax=Meloidogyne hapla TaxID=6305 RepID=A0A1I8BQS3_MELHA